MSFNKKYLTILSKVLNEGSLEQNRTGVSAYSIPSATLTHDCADGAPVLTIRKCPVKSVLVELEGFIKGINSKKWYQERGCRFWSEWANPQKVKYGNDSESKKRMLEEDDLGIIYGNNWRDFHDPLARNDTGMHECKLGDGVDQLKSIINTLKKNPQDRRMLCLAWNPLALDYAALPACHVLWRVMVIGGKLHLSWFQRSCDYILGIPANIFSYYTLLHLISKETGYEMGTVTGHLDHVHVYENHKAGAKELLNRNSDTPPPTIQTPNFTSIFDWQASDTQLLHYNPLPAIKFEVAV